jgi:hypothetical protein
MPRKLRIEYPGAMYHVMNRGDHRENIFKDDEDHRRFLSTLELHTPTKACGMPRNKRCGSFSATNALPSLCPVKPGQA